MYCVCQYNTMVMTSKIVVIGLMTNINFVVTVAEFVLDHASCLIEHLLQLRAICRRLRPRDDELHLIIVRRQLPTRQWWVLARKGGGLLQYRHLLALPNEC